MTRTTLSIDDDVLRRLKETAAQRGKTMGTVATELLRQAMTPARGRSHYRLDLRGWDAELLPGVDILDRDKLFDVMDGR